MTREEQIKKIYEEIMYPNYDRGHTMVMGCCMLGDVLGYLENIEMTDRQILELLYLRVYKSDCLEDQSSECISFIYSLIKENENSNG